jgi:hypothetical protein
MGRRYAGIDIAPAYVQIARERVRNAPDCAPPLLVGRASYPGKRALAALAAAEAGSRGKAAETKHKRKSYGRGAAAATNGRGASAPAGRDLPVRSP